jgi:hypothetical protein
MVLVSTYTSITPGLVKSPRSAKRDGCRFLSPAPHPCGRSGATYTRVSSAEWCRRPRSTDVCTLPPPAEGTIAPKTMQTGRLRQRARLQSWLPVSGAARSTSS